MGEHEIVALLAVGGTAEIYLARMAGVAGFEKFVVIKCLHEHLADDAEFVGMFLDEARLSAQLGHSNIVQTTTLGEAEGRYYIVMEYLPGLSLSFIARHATQRLPERRLPADIILIIIAQACSGLHYAHQRKDASGRPLNIVHRDVSPQNLVVSFDGIVKLVDFGIAKAEMRDTHTKSGTIKGKFAYMSPEQCMAGTVDRRTDIFALGIVMHELLTGNRLFKRASTYETYRAIIDSEPPPPSHFHHHLDPFLDEIVMRALRRNPDDRYPTADAFGETLANELHRRGKAVSAAPLAAFFEQYFGKEIAEHAAKMRELATGQQTVIDENWDEDLALDSGYASDSYARAPSDVGVTMNDHVDDQATFDISAGASRRAASSRHAVAYAYAPTLEGDEDNDNDNDDDDESIETIDIDGHPDDFHDDTTRIDTGNHAPIPPAARRNSARSLPIPHQRSDDDTVDVPRETTIGVGEMRRNSRSLPLVLPSPVDVVGDSDSNRHSQTLFSTSADIRTPTNLASLDGGTGSRRSATIPETPSRPDSQRESVPLPPILPSSNALARGRRASDIIDDFVSAKTEPAGPHTGSGDTPSSRDSQPPDKISEDAATAPLRFPSDDASVPPPSQQAAPQASPSVSALPSLASPVPPSLASTLPPGALSSLPADPRTSGGSAPAPKAGVAAHFSASPGTGADTAWAPSPQTGPDMGLYPHSLPDQQMTERVPRTGKPRRVRRRLPLWVLIVLFLLSVAFGLASTLLITNAF